MSDSLTPLHSLESAGIAANNIAQSTVFHRELQTVAANTRSAYQNDLKTWGEYLSSVRVDVSDRDWYNDPQSWRGVTAGTQLRW